MSKATPNGGGPIVGSYQMTQQFGDGYAAEFFLSGNDKIDALLGGTKWGARMGEGLTLTYSFPHPASIWEDGYGNGEPQQADYFSPMQQQAFEKALDAWAEVSNLKFQRVDDTATEVGDIRVAFCPEPADVAGHTYLPAVGLYYFSGSTVTSGGETTAASGDVWIDIQSKTKSDWTEGTYIFQTLLHEIGHGLGLDHPFADGEDFAILTGSENSYQYSIMSYTEHPEMGVLVERDNWSWRWSNLPALTPMLYDIAAIQYLYGANMGTRSGDTTYDFSADQPFLKTIWDGGGEDTLDASNQQYAVTLDLREGHFSSIGIRQTKDNETFAARNNVAIAYDAKIENAVGSDFNDTIFGNALDNQLTGGKGNDTLDGGAGNDTAIFSGLSSAFTWTKNGDQWTVTGPDGTDTLSNIEHLRFDDKTINLDGSTPQPDPTPGDDTIYGSEYDDELDGNENNNTIFGRDGDDMIFGRDGNDTIYGENGEDMLGGDEGNDMLFGGPGNDVLGGLAGDDTLDGGEGEDSALFIGRLSSYRVEKNDGSVTVTGPDGRDTLYNIEKLWFLNEEDYRIEDEVFVDDLQPQPDPNPQPDPTVPAWAHETLIVQQGRYGNAQGNDTYVVSPLLISQNEDMYIVDTEGNNTVQLLDGLNIDRARILDTAIELQLTNGAKVTVLGADKMDFTVGGNPLAGESGQSFSYNDFVRHYFHMTPDGEMRTYEDNVTIGSNTVPGSHSIPASGHDETYISQHGRCSCYQGNDTYLLSPLMISANAELTIVDTEGHNTVQLLDGLHIKKVYIHESAIRFELINGAETTVLRADEMDFVLGGDPLAGESGSNPLSYNAFVQQYFHVEPDGNIQTLNVDITIDFLGPAPFAANTVELVGTISNAPEEGEFFA